MATSLASSLTRTTLVGVPVSGQTRQKNAARPVNLAVRAAAADQVDAPPPPPKFCGGLPGNTAPMGDFDPMNMLDGLTPNDIRRYREAEVTHGRVCMLASVGILVGENFNPLFDGKITGIAINHFQQVPAPFWTAVVFGVGLAEASRASTGWVNPVGSGNEPNENTLFTLRQGYTPGDIGYDPLGIKPTNAADLAEMQTKEINNGRLAMIGTLGMVVQELVSGEKIF